VPERSGCGEKIVYTISQTITAMTVMTTATVRMTARVMTN
jgi:hypothetical protein